ncbi:MAG: DUF2059 domain-containing protein [Lysobacteraceae bacterium]
MLAIALALCAGTVAAQDHDASPATPEPQAQPQAQEQAAPAQAVDPHKAAVIRELLEVTGANAIAMQMADSLLEGERQGNPDIPPAFWSHLRDKLRGLDMAATLIPVYDRHFSTEDLEAAVAFYRSPGGQRMLKEMPAVMKESLAIGQELGRQIAQQVLGELKNEPAAGKTKHM